MGAARPLASQPVLPLPDKIPPGERHRLEQITRRAFASTQVTSTPRSSASRCALRSPAAEGSTPVTSKPREAKNTLSRPSPQPRSKTRPPGGILGASSSASSEGAVPNTYVSDRRTYS